MTLRIASLAALAALALAGPGLAQGPITVEDAYARSSGAMGRSGAAFMVITNTATEEDRLVAAASDIAMRVELHTHIDMGDGVMRMTEVEGGIAIPAGGSHALERGGDHVMFMGLTRPMEQGDTIGVTLTFEKAGEITVEIPVDMDRMPTPGTGSGSGASN